VKRSRLEARACECYLAVKLQYERLLAAYHHTEFACYRQAVMKVQRRAL